MSQRKSGAILSYSNIIAKNLVYFLYTPFLLRYVGQSDYGLFQMTNSVMMSLSLLSMGFSSAYVRFYTIYSVKKDADGIRKLNGLYMIIFACISIVAFIIGMILVLNTSFIFGSKLSNRELTLTKYLMLIMVLDVAITFISSVFDSNITVNERFIFQQTRQLLQTFLVPMICVPLVFMGVGVLSIEITQVAVTVLFLVLNVRYCLNKLEMKFSFKNIQFILLKDLLLFSFFIFLNQVVDLINNNVPNFILGVTQGAKMVATFSIAVQIKNMFFMLSTSMSGIFIPKVNSLVSRGKSNKELTSFMTKVGRIQMTLLFFVLGGFIVIGRFFISVWAGKQNSMAYYLVIMMVFPTVIPLSQNLGIEIQRAMNKHIFRSIICLIFAIVNIFITYWGSIYFGLLGASIGYVVSVVFANVIFMNWYYYKKMHLDIREYWSETIKTTVPFFFATSILLIMQIWIRVDDIYSFLLFGFIYILIYSFIFISFIANRYERDILLGIIRKRN